MSTAREVVLDEIRSAGPITFARYMEIALYGEGVGYYATGSFGIGRGGDFFTASSMGPAFGAVIARQLEEMWRILGCPDPFVVVEQGAGDGWLARDILAGMPEEPLAAVQYRIIEPLPKLIDRQKETLGVRAGRVVWVPKLDDLPRFVGVHVSNELVDAFPFHLLEAHGDGWHELRVGQRGGNLVFVEAPLSFDVPPLPLRPTGYIAEWRPSVEEWLRSLADRMQRGFVLTFDYGMPRWRMLDPARARGTFACYRNHRRDDNPLERPGQKDITAHVDFTAMEEAARATGLLPLGLCPQGVFLVGAAESLLRECEGKPDHPLWRSLRGLVHPEVLGNSFHAFAMGKGVDAPLSGFKFRS